MKKINEKEMRNLNGGWTARKKCGVCGYEFTKKYYELFSKAYAEGWVICQARKCEINDTAYACGV